ncbi:MAG: hypothetical protein V3R86_07390 [Candidatus Hydrothermarchaeaceae archaeon]
MNDYLILLNFAGLFFLLIANSIHNFYQSKRIYHLLELVGEGLIIRPGREKNTIEKMIAQGMELESRTE